MPITDSETVDGELTITMVRGDTDDVLVTVTDDADPPVAYDLSKAADGTANRPAVIRFAVKESPDDESNAEALILKSSRASAEIEVLAQTGATLGQCRLYLDKPDTEEADPGTYRWDMEVTRQGAIRTGAGTYAVTAGSKVVTGTGTAFTSAKKGDVLNPLGALNVGRPAIITKVTSNTSMEVDVDDYATESGEDLEIRRGKSKTSVRGDFVLQSGVVAE